MTGASSKILSIIFPFGINLSQQAVDHVVISTKPNKLVQ